jgi:hypothetical protein
MAALGHAAGSAPPVPLMSRLEYKRYTRNKDMNMDKQDRQD